MSGSAAVPAPGLEVTNFSELVVGQKYIIVKQRSTDPVPIITTETFIDSDIDPSPSYIPRFLYKFRKEGGQLSTVTYQGDPRVKVYRQRTVGERNAPIESIVNGPNKSNKPGRKSVMNWVLKTTGASTNGASMKKTRRLQRRGKNKRTRRH